MNDPLISRFAVACGATSALDLRVDLSGGGILAKGSVSMPFSLVGRDEGCDVTLTDAEVNPRHCWLQVLGGRVFAIDLGSRTGLQWPGEVSGSGWLDVDRSVQVGPFKVWLCSPITDRPQYFPPGYNPLQSDSETGSRASVVLEFRNGRRAKDRWTVNRLITLVGRSPDCKIHLTADDIAGYHCGLVHTSDGLWVVDLSGRGVVVNGERMRVSPLKNGAELWVGRFLIGVQYPGADNTPALARGGLITPPNPLPGLAAPTSQGHSTPPMPREGLEAEAEAEDEVPLGAVPVSDPDGELPSSHIMADAFRLWPGGPLSLPIEVSSTASISSIGSVPVASSPQPRSSPSYSPERKPSPVESVPLLLNQLCERQNQIVAQFQQSLMLLVQLFGCLPREQMPALQRELSRLNELNTELVQLQIDATRKAAEIAIRASAPPQPLTDSTPLPDTITPGRPATASAPTDAASLHNWILDRIEALQKEQQQRWRSVVSLFGDKPR